MKTCQLPTHSLFAFLSIHIAGTTNPAEILSKHLDYSSVLPLLQPILFWKGNTGDLLDKAVEQQKA